MIPAAIYGRDAELEQLRQLVSRRRSFLLHGPSGVGKTLLLKHVAREVPRWSIATNPPAVKLFFGISQMACLRGRIVMSSKPADRAV